LERRRGDELRGGMWAPWVAAWLLWRGCGAVCVDENNMCDFWKQRGECEANPGYMLLNCALSCGSCSSGSVEVGADGAEVDAAAVSTKNPLVEMQKSEEGGVFLTISHELEGEASLDVVWMGDSTKADVSTHIMTLAYGESKQLQTFEGHVFGARDAAGAPLARFRVFPHRPSIVINRRSVDIEASDGCVDKQDSCVGRAQRGECTTAPGWMSMMCSKSCAACYLRDPAVRCARSNLNMMQEAALLPGGLDDMFSKLQTTWPQFNVTLHSAPLDFHDKVRVAPDAIGGPWVATLDNFITDAEVDSIIKSVNHSFSRSTDQGATDAYGEQQKVVSTSRTSENAWCTGACESSKAVQDVMQRIEAVTHVPIPNFESFQVLRYLPGQFYRAHHDMSGNDNKLPCGPRVYTFFLYLSDVEEGGETEFPNLKRPDGTTVKITPKRGTALLWPSVQNDDPTRQDSRTRHAALPVRKGVKYAANAWIHTYDYSEPNLWGCTGSFD